MTISAAILQRGELCDAAQVCGRCAAGLSCDVGLGSCQPLPAEGEPCAWAFGCAPGLICGDVSTCQPVATATALGAPCDDNVGPFCDWSAGLGCQRDFDAAPWMRCVPFAQADERCTSTDVDGTSLGTPCDPRQPLYCADDGFCRRLGEPGTVCNRATQCLSKLCDAATGRCVPYTVDQCFEG